MKWLDLLFHKPEKLLAEPLSFESIITDIHSHLIPNIDDGSKSMDESLGLIKSLYDLGYRKLITTPHIMNDYYKNTPEIIHSGLENLRKALKDASINMEVEAAAEYLLDDGFESKLQSGKLLTFGKNYVLVEISYFAEPPSLHRMIFELQTQGYRVVLAHPERYKYWHQRFDQYQQLVDRGVYLQLNINSLTGWYSPESKKMAEKLIEMDMISFLGTDLHNQNYLTELQRSLLFPKLKQVMESKKLLNKTI
jgi:tyrosine-protein phosphatase YwqE